MDVSRGRPEELQALPVTTLKVVREGIANHVIAYAMIGSGLLAPAGFMAPFGQRDIIYLVPVEGVSDDEVLARLTEEVNKQVYNRELRPA